jgi:hypothetical protein
LKCTNFLYAIDADGGRIYGWAVDAEGTLDSVLGQGAGDGGRDRGELTPERYAARVALHGQDLATPPASLRWFTEIESACGKLS